MAWISLTESDNQPRSFWSYFVAALADLGVVPPDHPLTQLVPGLGDEDEFMIRLMSELATLPTSVVLILDDFHVIHEPTVHRRVYEMLGYQVDQLRLVLLTRSDPPLPLHRLRVIDQLGELRARDLAFGPADATALLASHGLDVAADDAALLLERTEGWAAGLRLAALHLTRDGGSRAAAGFAGDDRSVMGYLAEEVLASQSPELRDFLLRTSIVERLTSALARELTGDDRAQHHLESLEASNAFVVGLGSGREWFRYHALLREMLQHRLRVESPALVPELHRSAAHWLADNGQTIEAMRHAADGGDWDLVARLFVAKGFPHLVSIERAALHSALSRVPTERYGDSPALAVSGAARMFYERRWSEMADLLEVAVGLRADGHDSPRLQVCLAVFFSTMARVEGDADAVVARAAEALGIVGDPGSDDQEGFAYRAIALNLLGSGQLWCGATRAAEETLREAAEVARASRIEATEVNALSHQALALVVDGRIDAGIEASRRAVEIVDRRGWAPLPQAATAHLAMVLAAVHRDDLAAAQEHVVKARDAARPERIPRVAVELAQVWLDLATDRVDTASARLEELALECSDWQPPLLVQRAWNIVEAELRLATGDPDGAAQQVGVPEDRETPYAEEQLVRARALLALGDPVRAETVLAPVREAGAGAHRAEAWLLTAVAADSLREDNRALTALDRAVVAAAPHLVRRPFVMHRERVTRLREQLQEVDPVAAARATDLLGPSRVQAPVGAPALVEDLTDRELIVVRYLATMRTNDEIAEELYVSVNTVKAHLKRVFRKLGVDSRREAVRRARDLGLVGDTGPAEERPVR